jgi:hypothetical protein
LDRFKLVSTGPMYPLITLSKWAKDQVNIWETDRDIQIFVKTK